MADQQEAGKVIHYYDKLGVAVVRLSESLEAGDMIKVARGETDFEMKVGSMQIDHKEVNVAKAGDEVAIKVDEPTKEGAVVYKVMA